MVFFLPFLSYIWLMMRDDTIDGIAGVGAVAGHWIDFVLFLRKVWFGRHGGQNPSYVGG